MFYKLLGMFVWKGAKLVLRRKYGPTYVPVPVLAGGLVAILLAVGLFLLKRDGSDSS